MSVFAINSAATKSRFWLKIGKQKSKRAIFVIISMPLIARNKQIWSISERSETLPNRIVLRQRSRVSDQLTYLLFWINKSALKPTGMNDSRIHIEPWMLPLLFWCAKWMDADFFTGTKQATLAAIWSQINKGKSVRISIITCNLFELKDKLTEIDTNIDWHLLICNRSLHSHWIALIKLENYNILEDKKDMLLFATRTTFRWFSMQLILFIACIYINSKFASKMH